MIENIFTLIALYIRRMSVCTDLVYITIKDKHDIFTDIAFRYYDVKSENTSDILKQIYDVLNGSLFDYDEVQDFNMYHYNGNIYITIKII